MFLSSLLFFPMCYAKPEEVIEQLESSEFFDLDTADKVQILVGLCHRIMGTYSIQDYMEEKQQDAAELWCVRFNVTCVVTSFEHHH